MVTVNERLVIEKSIAEVAQRLTDIRPVCSAEQTVTKDEAWDEVSELVWNCLGLIYNE